MKTGILTFHGSHNYGSVLQAYALSRAIADNGHNVEIINLRPKSQREVYPVISGKGIHRIYQLLYYRSLLRRYNEFERFIHNVLPIGRTEFSSTCELVNHNFAFEAYVCGSDQIWNPACPDHESAYFLSFLNSDDPALKIAYGPSLGKASFSTSELDIIIKGIRIFDQISVREETGAALIRTITDKPVFVVCDPVLLLEREKWEQFAVRPKETRPYILAYFLENNHGSRDQLEYLKKHTGYHVITVNEYTRDCFRTYQKAYGTSPEEFVGLLANASLVYTNSFHGTAFATVFERPFITAVAKDENVQNNSDSRKIDFLKMCGLTDLIYQNELPDLNKVMQVDFTEVRKTIENMRETSADYLAKCFSQQEERES